LVKKFLKGGTVIYNYAEIARNMLKSYLNSCFYNDSMLNSGIGKNISEK